MNKYHISKKNYVSRVFASIGLAIFFSLTYFSLFLVDNSTEEVNIDNIFLVVLFFVIFFVTLVGGLILQWLIMKRHVFYDQGENFIVEKGLIFKKQVKIPYKNIHTIAIKRSLLDLMLKTSKVELDSGTTAAPLPEGRLMVDKDYALVLKEFLENKKSNNNLELANPETFKVLEKTTENVIYKARKRDMFLFGILKPGFLVTTISLVLFISAIIQISYLTTEETTELIVVIFASIGAIVGLILLLALFFGLVNLLSFYGYTLKINDDSLEYEYGLLSKTNFKFKKDKINGLYLKQSLGFKLVKQYSLEASIIGIGEFNQNNDNNKGGFESKYILPLAKKDKIEEVLKMIKKEKLINDEFIGPTKYRRLKFIILPLIFISIPFSLYFMFLFFYLLKYFIVTINIIILYSIIVVALVLRLKNHGYNINDDLLIKKGSFTVMKALIVKQRLQQVMYKQGPVEQLMKVGKINFKYKKLLGTVILNGFTKQEFNQIKQVVK